MLIPSFVIADKVKITNGTQEVAISDNNLLVMPYQDAVAHNLITGHYITYALGYCTNIPTTAMRDISELGVNIIPIPTVAATVSVVSDNANDTAAGTGVRSVMLEGLDASYNAIEEIITLNGLTPVTSVNSYIRFNDFHSMTVGSNGYSSGSITAYNGATVYRKISAGVNRDMTCHFTVPNGKTAQLILVATSAMTSKDVRFNLRATADRDGNLMAGVYLFQSVCIDGSGYLPLKRWYPAKTDIKLSGINLTSGTVTGSGQFDLIIEG